MKDSIYGLRAKIGLIYPAPGWIMEPEFYLMAPEGVATYTTRIGLDACNVDGVTEIGNRSIEAAKLLAQAPVDVIALGCTSGSFVSGRGYDLELIKKMERESKGIPCTTTTTAVIEAFKLFNAKKLAVATPYIDEINARAQNFLEQNGLTVTNIKGLGLLTDAEIDSQSLETVYKLAKETDTKDADAVFIACTGLRSVPVLQALESALSKPVISAVQATFWHCLRIAGIKDKVKGFGRLLEL